MNDPTSSDTQDSKPKPELVTILLQELPPLLGVEVPVCYQSDPIRAAMFLAGVVRREKPALFRLVPTLRKLVRTFRQRGCGESDKYERAYLLGKIKWTGTLDVSKLQPKHPFTTKVDTLSNLISGPDTLTIIQRIEDNPTFVPLVCWGTGCHDDELIDEWEHQ